MAQNYLSNKNMGQYRDKGGEGAIVSNSYVMGFRLDCLFSVLPQPLQILVEK